MRTAALLILAVIVAGCGSGERSAVHPDGSDVRLTCSMAGRSFQMGQELPPAELTITSTTDRPVDLIGPTLSVISCTLLQPDGTPVELRLAMPTGRDPADMPKVRLGPGTSIDLTPAGIWYYRDGIGYEPYVFERPGTYEIHCRYEEARSNTLALEVHREPSRAGNRPEEG